MVSQKEVLYNHDGKYFGGQMVAQVLLTFGRLRRIDRFSPKAFPAWPWIDAERRARGLLRILPGLANRSPAAKLRVFPKLFAPPLLPCEEDPPLKSTNNVPFLLLSYWVLGEPAGAPFCQGGVIKLPIHWSLQTDLLSCKGTL